MIHLTDTQAKRDADLVACERMNAAFDIATLASQQAYAARPFAVRWVDSHASCTNRFDTLSGAFEYIQAQWLRVQHDVAQYRYRESHLWQSHLETPEGRTQLSYVLLASDVSSYSEPISPDTRAPIRERLWNTGRCSTTNEIADIYVACIRAGMNDAQAFAMACLAHDTAKGFEWNIEGTAQSVAYATRARHATDHPQGCWATLVRKHGQGALYFQNDDPRIIDWTEPKESATAG